MHAAMKAQIPQTQHFHQGSALLMVCCRLETQGQAESYLERLHKMVENDLNEFIEGTTKVDAWAKWRENLIGLTDVTRSHFSKLVMELEKGLDAMLADYQNGAPASPQLDALLSPSLLACGGSRAVVLSVAADSFC